MNTKLYITIITFSLQYHRGRPPTSNIWVFGMVDTSKTPSLGLLHLVSDQSRASLLPIIQAHTLPGTIIHSDDFSLTLMIFHFTGKLHQHLFKSLVPPFIQAIGLRTYDHVISCTEHTCMIMLFLQSIWYDPLVKHWTMYFEAKHNHLKKLAQHIGNFINISSFSWTLAC